MNRASFLAIAVLTATVLSGCDLAGSASDAERPGPPVFERKESVTVGPGVKVSLLVPDTIKTGESVDLRLSIANVSGREVKFWTPSSCLFDSGIYHNGTRFRMDRRRNLCLAVVTPHTLASGTDLTFSYEIRTVRENAEDERSVDPGTYTARIELDWRFDDKWVERTLEETFFVEGIYRAYGIDS